MGWKSISKQLGSTGARWLVIAALVEVSLRPGFGQTFHTTVPGDIMDQFRSQRVTWTTNIWVYANNLFGILALIEFAWSAAVMLLEKSDLQSWTSALIRKLMWIGAFYALLLNGRTWIPAIIDSFTQMGQNAAGTGALSPTDVFVQGLSIAGALMDGASTSEFFKNPGSSFALVFAALLIMVSYVVIAINFIVTIVESYLVVSVGFIFLGFGGSRWTVPYTERYIGLAVSIGIKVLLLYCLISAGMGLGAGWVIEAQGVGTSVRPSMTAFDVMGASLIFMMMCWQIPKLFSAVLGGSPALTGGDLIATTTGVVAAGAAVASVAAGGAALAARGAAAVSGIGAAAGGVGGASGAGSSLASVSSGMRSSGGGGVGGGGAVPPPPFPSSGPPSNGRPNQPNPPSRSGGGSHGATPDVAGVGSVSSGSYSIRNGSGRSYSSNGNGGLAASPTSSGLSEIGGENLAGSGFENERPAAGFALAAPRTSAASVPPPPPSSLLSTDDEPTSNSGRVDVPPSGGLGAGSSSSAVSEVQSLAGNNGGQIQPPPQSRRERLESTARRADHALSGAAGRLRGIRTQLGGLPSDAAPHTSPPRMPIDHHD